MANKKGVFESLRNFGEPFKDSKGRWNVRADFSGFMNTETQVRQANNSYVVANFTNLSGVTDKINELLGTDFVDDEEYNNIPANFSIFTNTAEEATALSEKLENRSRVMATVTVTTHEYEDTLYLDLIVSTPYIEAPQDRPRNAPKRKSTAELELDDDLPI